MNQNGGIYSNLNRNNKFLGIVDYKSLIILLSYVLLIWQISGLIVKNTMSKIYVLTILTIPILGIFYANKSSENVSHMVYCILKYVMSPKLFVYKIQGEKHWIK